ncbi:hypothetical protein [Amycolatopsis anabasis]|uniref:hypothetical protein n=1 Tax=Amycolatopsis anabasis TaxID=1840409 RepID=UPI00131BECC8|nr:hypothetical protein [Amycolatopsis anabasis]
MGVREPDQVLIEIDELLFDGFGPVNRDRVAAAFQRELVRLLSVRSGLSEVLSVDQDQDVAELELPALPPVTSPRGLGVALARAVTEGLR